MLYGANKYQPITIKLKNPINIARPDEVIVLPISSVKVVLGNFDENFLTIRDRGKILPYEIIKNDGGDNIIFQVSFHPFEMKKITLSWSKNKPNVKAGRTQAYLAVKKNYILKDGIYSGGNFESVNSVVVPKSHFQHDALYQMEGPAWESDKAAYRFYLDDRNRTDIFGKSTPKMVLDIVGKNDLLSGDESYEKPLWWGQDIFKVGNSLGIGSVAAYIKDKVETVSQTDSIKCSVVNNSVFSSVVSEHFGWVEGNDKVNVKTNYSIYPGSRLTEVNVKTDKPVENFCTGLAKHENTEFLKADNNGKWGYIGIWGKQTIINDNLGIALFYNTDERIKLTEDKLSQIVVLKPEGNSANYYFAECWEKEKNGIKTLNDFQNFLNNTIECLNNPVTLEIQ
jgi:hypothetical protein